MVFLSSSIFKANDRAGNCAGGVSGEQANTNPLIVTNRSYMSSVNDALCHNL